jgi:hypothetical protein
MADMDFAQAKTRREQIAVACKHLRGYETRKRFTYNAIARFMGVAQKASIESQFHTPLSSIGWPGRSPLLQEEAQSWMIESVDTRCAEHDAVTYAELLDGLKYDHGISMSGDSLRHIVRNTTILKFVVRISKDSERLDVDVSEMDAWYNIISEKLMGISWRFVFMVDQTGCSGHIDSHEVTIVLPIDYPDPSVPIPVNRRTQRSTFTACIAADGYRMKPFVIVDRAIMEAEVELYGYDSLNVFLASQVMCS